MHAARLGHRSTANRPGARRDYARIDRLGPPLALGLGALAVLMFVIAVPLGSAVRQGGGANLWLIPYGLVGAVVAYRQPRNPIGVQRAVEPVHASV